MATAKERCWTSRYSGRIERFKGRTVVTVRAAPGVIVDIIRREIRGNRVVETIWPRIVPAKKRKAARR